MGRKKIDNRIRILIENCVSSCYRSLFVVVGSKGRDQVVILHHMLSKAAVKARPSVLWCYKKELGFSSHRKKRMRQLQKKIKSGELSMNEDDPFELFIASTDIRYCYYRDSHKILGQTFGMLVLQDFEALTPNLLARTIETVEGGGIIVILLQTLTSLRQLYTMTMDVHARYRTESHQYVVGRFNERFILSLPSCTNCLVLDDHLNILPISSNALSIKPLPPKSMEDPQSPEIQELSALKESLQDTQPVGVLINHCRTLDQAKAVLKFVDALSEETLRTTVTLTSARGRGKSAALGLAIAGAVAFNYSNIFVTSPTPENLKTLFSFALKGFDALEYQEHGDYEVIQSLNPEFNKAVVRVNIFRNHRQTIQYIHPSDANKLGQAELVVIDEAAAIPLPLVKSLLGPYVVFMASTINGYEGTGRSLSLKLINQLRQQSATLGNSAKSGDGGSTYSAASSTGRILHEITLDESIRYRNGDSVEDWLNRLLCLDATVVSHLSSGCPEPQQCQLYYISRDTLFSYHKAAESFLQRFVSLYVSSHYKNSPDDLQLMSDAPAHHLFCLLPPVDHNMRSLPEVLCIVQVCLEGAISQDTVMQELSRGKRASGDLIPWTLSQQFQDKDFASLSGARIVRIATHPDYQKMGYGLRTLQLLQEYFEGNIPTLEETPTHVPPDPDDTDETSEGLLEEQLQPRKSLPPLLLKLSERRPEKLDYLGVSYGLTEHLLRFWKKAGFVPVYLRQTPNELTGEHSCIMLKVLNSNSDSSVTWLCEFWTDFCRRYVSLLSYQFRSFSSSLALSILKNNIRNQSKIKEMAKEELDTFFTPYDMKRLEMYSKQLLEYHIIMDLMPTVSRLYFLHRLGDLHLSGVQAAILLSIGLQHKTVDVICKDLDLPSQQVLGLFSRTIRRITQFLCRITEHAFEETLMVQKDVVMEPTVQTIEQELTEVAMEFKEKQKSEAKKLQEMDFAEYAIKGSEDEWHKALQGSRKTLISIKSILKKTEKTENFHPSKKRKRFNKNFKKHT